MSSKAMIQQSLNVSDMLMNKYLTDLDSEAFLLRPVHGMNHLAWQVGHLIVSERKMLEVIKPGVSPELPAEFETKHAMDKHGSDTATDFHTKDEYLALWKAQRAATQSTLETMSEADLDAPCPDEKMRQMASTVGALFNLAGLHSVMHSGQFVAVRRSKEMPIAF